MVRSRIKRGRKPRSLALASNPSSDELLKQIETCLVLEKVNSITRQWLRDLLFPSMIEEMEGRSSESRKDGRPIAMVCNGRLFLLD